MRIERACGNPQALFLSKKLGLNLLFPKKIVTFAPLKRREIRYGFGRMAEWSNAAVLKTVDLHGSGGSNPSSSAKNGSLL